MEEVARGAIQVDPENPRVIDEYAKKQLDKSLNSYGLLEPILVNRRNMRVVSGNQRLAWLDAKNGGTGYTLKVAFCDLSEKQAKAAGIMLNNKSAQGDWDLEKLEKQLDEIMMDIDPLPVGFSDMDIQMLFPDSPELKSAFAETPPETVEKNVAGLRETKKISREQRDKGNAAVADKHDSEHYVIVSFPTRTRKNEFLRAVGIMDDERYVDGERLATLIGKPVAG